MKNLFLALVCLFVSAMLLAQTKEVPPPPPPKVNLTKFKPPIMTAKGEKADDFYKRNPSVKEIFRQGNVLFLNMKDGTKQEYHVLNKDEMKSFTDKYGESPITLPAPPPPPKKIS